LSVVSAARSRHSRRWIGGAPSTVGALFSALQGEKKPIGGREAKETHFFLKIAKIVPTKHHHGGDFSAIPV
jgi:hypothetical protein